MDDIVLGKDGKTLSICDIKIKNNEIHFMVDLGEFSFSEMSPMKTCFIVGLSAKITKSSDWLLIFMENNFIYKLAEFEIISGNNTLEEISNLS